MNPKIILVIVLATVFFEGCRKTNDPQTYEKPEFIVAGGDHQTGYFGALLPDSIVIQLVPHSSIPYSEYRIMFRTVQGNGVIVHVDQEFPDPYSTARLDSQWKLKVPWSLGCDRIDQAARFYLFMRGSVNAGMKGALDSVTITATAMKPSGWARSCGPQFFYSNLHSVLFRSCREKVYMLNHGMIFSSADGGINWQTLEGYTGSSRVVDFQFNSSGMFILNESEGMSFSADLKTWHLINNGIQRKYIPTALLVEDSVIYLNYDESGLWRSRDNGQSWKSVQVDWRPSLLIRRHPNGPIYLFDDWPALYQLDSNGEAWWRFIINPIYLKGKPHDLAIDPAGNLVIGSDQALISILTPGSLTGETHSFYQSNTSDQYVDNIQFRNGMTYCMVNGNDSAGIYSSENNWARVRLDFPRPVLGFFLFPDGTYLLPSDNGIYYYSH